MMQCDLLLSNFNTLSFDPYFSFKSLKFNKTFHISFATKPFDINFSETINFNRDF